MQAVGSFDQLGLAKLLDELVSMAQSHAVVRFHRPVPYRNWLDANHEQGGKLLLYPKNAVCLRHRPFARVT